MIRAGMSGARSACRIILRERLGAGLAAEIAGGSDNLTVTLLNPGHKMPEQEFTTEIPKDSRLKASKRYQYVITARYNIRDMPDPKRCELRAQKIAVTVPISARL